MDNVPIYCGGCAHLERLFRLPFCSAWDTTLKRDDDHPMRCKECLSHGVNTDHAED